MNNVDTIRLVRDMTYPAECAELRVSSHLYAQLVQPIRAMYDARQEHHSNGYTYVLDLDHNREPISYCHGIAPIWVDGNPTYQYYRYGYRDWVLTATHFYGGFAHTLSPLYSINIDSDEIIAYHDCECRYCSFDKINPLGYPTVRCLSEFSTPAPFG